MQKISKDLADKLVSWGNDIKAIAQTGLSFSNDFHNQSRYQDLQRIASEILASVNSDMNFDPNLASKLNQILQNDMQNGVIGYVTPKVSVAAAVFNSKKQLLLVRPNGDNEWCLPGGWADELWSPSENAQREVFEETGISARAQKLLGVFDSRRHPFRTTVTSYTLLFACEFLEGQVTPQKIEIEAAHYFDETNLPPLIPGTQMQVKVSFAWQKGEWLDPYFDS